MVGLQGFVEVCASKCVSSDALVVRNPPAWLSEPRVAEHEDTIEGKVFEVQRYLIGLDQGIYRVRERVSEHGNYDLRESTLIERDASKLGILHVGEH